MKNVSRRLAGIAFGVVLALGLMGCSGNVEEHEHTFATEWTSDATHHWHAATCEHEDEVSDKTEHTWDAGVVTKAISVSEEGVKTFTCTECLATKVVNFSALGWCESPVDAETGLSATSSSKYIYFGVFPKTVLPLGSTVTVDEEDFVQMGANTCFKGSDGEYYALAQENGAYGADAKYENGEQVKNESEYSYRYFKVEPIKWKVLTTTYDIDGVAGSATGALLLAEDILTANVPYMISGNGRIIDGESVRENNYKHSQIRAYLNGLTYKEKSGEVAKWNGKGFLQAAFTETAQSNIVTTTVDNSAASTTDAGNNLSQATSYACENTSDKIFLLSEKEVTNTAYGFAAYDSCGVGNARIRMPTDYAKANYAICWDSTDGYGGFWWLRSPHYNDSYFVRYVAGHGYADCIGDVYDSEFGVVPALCISLQ